MSRIKINEIDNSRETPKLQDAHNILIIGYYDKADDAKELKLYNSLKEFQNDYPEIPSKIISRLSVETGEAISGSVSVNDGTKETYDYSESSKAESSLAFDPGLMSYVLVKRVLSYGLGVYFLNIKSLGNFDISTLSNKFVYDISFISLGGFSSIPSTQSGVSINDVVTKIVSPRKDCVLLLDVPYGTDPSTIYDRSGNMTISDISSIDNGAVGSYCAAYGPWTYQAYSIGKKSIIGPIPPSSSVLECLGASLYRGNPAYRALAGVNRGQVLSASGIEYNLSEDESVNIWQKKDSDSININPIIHLNNTYGYVIYGQRTIYKDRLSSLKSLNVRVAANMVKKRIFKICLGLTFETNDLILWNEFKGQLDSYLSNMQYNRGLYNYRVVMDSESQSSAEDDMTVKGFVRCYFSRSAEYFDIDFTLTSNSAEFSEGNI